MHWRVLCLLEAADHFTAYGAVGKHDKASDAYCWYTMSIVRAEGLGRRSHSPFVGWFCEGEASANGAAGAVLNWLANGNPPDRPPDTLGWIVTDLRTSNMLPARCAPGSNATSTGYPHR